MAFERLPYLALSKTYNTNQQVPDLAGTMTAMMSGVKTKAGVIGVDEDVVRGDYLHAADHGVMTFLIGLKPLGCQQLLWQQQE